MTGNSSEMNYYHLTPGIEEEEDEPNSDEDPTWFISTAPVASRNTAEHKAGRGGGTVSGTKADSKPRTDKAIRPKKSIKSSKSEDDTLTQQKTREAQLAWAKTRETQSADGGSGPPSWNQENNSAATTPSGDPRDFLRGFVSPETFSDLVAAKNGGGDVDSGVGQPGHVAIRRRMSAPMQAGRRASQRFSRILEGVANYVIGPAQSISASDAEYLEGSVVPNEMFEDSDGVPCWDPKFAESQQRLGGAPAARQQQQPYWVEATARAQDLNTTPYLNNNIDGKNGHTRHELDSPGQSFHKDQAQRRQKPSLANIRRQQLAAAHAGKQQLASTAAADQQSPGPHDPNEHRQLTARITQLFDSLSLATKDFDLSSAGSSAVNEAEGGQDGKMAATAGQDGGFQRPVLRRQRTEASFFQKRRSVVSSYISDLATWVATSSQGLIESDAKSMNSLSNQSHQSQNGSQSGHSRKSSDTSQISVNSGSSCQEAAAGGEEDLWTTWGKIINEWDTQGKKKLPHIKELVRKGIPHHFRGIAWQVLCGAHESADKAKYSEYMKLQSACEKVIRRDIARTYPEHEFFKKKDGVGQEALFNVMKAYSIHDREVGYCQGSAFIVGLLLMQMPEEESFAVLVKIMQDYRMREMFKPSMAELGLCMYQLDTLVQEHIPELYVHFQSQAIHTNLYASSWFLTLFTTSLPITLSARVMDLFLSEGIEVIFRIALTLLMLAKHELLIQDMEGVIRYFQKDMPQKFEADQDAIFNMAFGLKINQKKMKRLEKEYTTMKCKEKEDEIELRRLRTENRLLRQRIDMLENESSELADRLIQGQVNRAEVEETTFAMKRELAAIRQHDMDTSVKLEEARERINKLSALLEEQQKRANCCSKEGEDGAAGEDGAGGSSGEPEDQELSLKTEIIKQKEEMIQCLQEELIKVRLREAENEDTIKKLREKLEQTEEEWRREREEQPEAPVASLQEELAATKLREAEASLALKDLRSKVGELNSMWQKHLKRAESPKEPAEVPSTPKKLLGSLLEGKETGRLEEELMTSRLKEVEAMAELKELRLKVMDLETQNQVSHNQLKRRGEEVKRLQEEMDASKKKNGELQTDLRESQRRFADLEGKLKEDLMMARIRDAENTQCVAELTQKISNLEYKNQELVAEGDLTSSLSESDRIRELQDKVACLRAQVTRLALMNSKLTQSLSMHNLATSFESDSDTSASTPQQSPGTSPTTRSSLNLDLGDLSFSNLSLHRVNSNTST